MMPTTRTKIERLPAQPQADTGGPAKAELLEISGWNENEIDTFIKDFTLPKDKTAYDRPNVAFFAVLIQKLEESEVHHLVHDLPKYIERLGLCVPAHISTLCRYVRRCTYNSFRKDKVNYTGLSQVPPPVKPKSSGPGNQCEKFGLTEDWLFVNQEAYSGPNTVTIGLVLELLAIKKQRGVTDTQCAKWVQRLFHLENEPYSGTIRLQWERIFACWQNLRSKKEQQKDYTLKPYLPPSSSKHGPSSHSEKRNQNSDKTETNANVDETACLTCRPCSRDTDACVHVVDGSTQCEAHFPTLRELSSIALKKSVVKNAVDQSTQSEGYFPTLQELAGNAFKKSTAAVVCDSNILFNLQKQTVQASEKLKAINKKIGRYAPRNVNKRDTRAKANRQALDGCQSEIESLTQRLGNAQKLVSKWKLKACGTECDKCESNISKVAELNDSIRELEVSKDLLEESLTETKQGAVKSAGGGVIKTLEVRDGHVVYNDEIRLVYMELLSLGVAIGKCSDIVQTVVGGLTDLEIEKLPAKSTTSGFQSESETVAQMHVADVMLENKDLTLHLDGSKKKFNEYASFQATRAVQDSDNSNRKETLSMGILEMSKGDTKAFIDTLLNVLGDLAETFTGDEEKINEVKTKLLANISNLMTDRHVVNKTFRVQLEETRRDLFEKHLDGFLEMPKERQDQLIQLHGMYCGLHVLANMGTSAAKALKVFEEIALPTGTRISEFAFEKGNARTFDLIFELSQSMTISGSMRTGRFADWEAFMKERNKQSRIVSFLRHRFNVLFVNGAAAYFHRHDIAEFLDHQNKNKMLNCVTDSILSPVCLAGLRALGIFAVLVTQPLWRVVERPDIHVFDLNKDWLHLKTSLDDSSKDSSDLLAGKSVFPDFPVEKDAVYEALFVPTTDEIEGLTKECLEVISFHTFNLVKRQLEDQLPGGKYANPTEEVLKITRSCPTSNRAGEKDFSDLDREVNRAPQRLTSHISGAVCFRNNKTWAYFQDLPVERRQRLIKRAIALAPRRRLKNRIRRLEVRKIRMREMEERKKKAEEKKRKEDLRMNSIIEKVMALDGVWDTEVKVAAGLESIQRMTKKVEAIKDQIRYQVVVLKRKFRDKSLSKFSVDGKKLTLPELERNFREMMSSGILGNLGDQPARHQEKTRHDVREVSEREQLIRAHREKESTTHREKESTRDATIPKKKTHKATPVQNKGPVHLSTAGKLLKSALERKRKVTSVKVVNEEENKKRRVQPSCQQPSVPEVGLFKFEENSVNNFIAVAFEDKWYLGQVLKVDNANGDEADVSFMNQVGRAYFQWPDKSNIEPTNALFVLACKPTIIPTGANLRIWRLPDEDVKEINRLYKQYSIKYFKK